jgi:hypothetical protein
LRRAGIIIDEATPKAKVLGETLRFVNENMGGRAQEDIKSYGGKLAQLSNSMSELRESIGRLIAEGLNLPIVVDYWKKAFDGMNKAVSGEGVTVLDTLEKRLRSVNEKIAAGGAETISKQKASPLWFITGGYSNAEIEIAKNLLIERNMLFRTIEHEKQSRANEMMLAEQKITEERSKQIKLKAQEDFTNVYNSLVSQRLRFELSTLEENHARFKEYVQDKVAVEKWYKEEKDRIDAEMLREAKKHSEMYSMFMQGAARGMKEALVDGFIKIAKREFEGLKDVVINFGNVMLEVAAQMAAIGILKKVGMAAFLGAAHTSGYMYPGIESSFGYRRKFHSGGEVPATLLEGEGVVNRGGMRSLGVDNLNKLNRGESMGGQTINNFYIQTIDERSFRERLQQHGDIYASASEMSIRDNSSLRHTSQRWG